jgi:dTDP-glucose pyrophosphorylase
MKEIILIGESGIRLYSIIRMATKQLLSIFSNIIV